MSSFDTDAGIPITEQVTDSGDYSFTWTEHYGIDNTPVRFELVYAPSLGKWRRLCWPDAHAGGHNAMGWPWPAVGDMDEAREMVKKRVGR